MVSKIVGGDTERKTRSNRGLKRGNRGGWAGQHVGVLCCNMGSIVVGGMCVALLGMFVWSGLRNAKMKRLPATRIADCRTGMQVKIIGKVVPVQTIAAPGSGRPCVAYVVSASFGERSVTKHFISTFVVEDSSGQVIVDCGDDGSVVGLDLDQDHKESGWLKHLDGTEIPGLAELGLSRAESIVEGILEPGERVAVLGQVRSVGGQTKIVRPKKGLFLVSDKPYFFGDSF